MAEQRGDGTSIPQIQLGIGQLWRVKVKNAYKRRRGATGGGIQKNSSKKA